MDKPTPEIPTSGGSYEVQGDGTLKPVHATQPAPTAHEIAQAAQSQETNRSARSSAPSDGE
jgi:hypothetical protein